MLAPISQDEFKAVSDEATRIVNAYADRARVPFIGILLSVLIPGWFRAT